MKSSELKERIEKKEAQISKIQKRIKKWEDAKVSEKAFEKEYDWLNTFEERKESLREEWKKHCDSEIRYANRDLDEAMTTLNKYKNALMLAEEKENKPVIKIFKDFFEKWKTEIIDHTTPLFNKLMELSRESCDLHNSRYTYLKTMTKEEYEEKVKSIRKQEKSLLADGWVSKMYDCRLYGSKTFEEYLDKYMEDRYYELVDKITKVTGEITDVSYLYVGHDGRINGTIVGENGKAKIETIIAGGDNEGIIVNVKCGPCAHYRVLVHKVK